MQANNSNALATTTDQGFKILPYSGATLPTHKPVIRYICDKCGCTEYRSGEIRTCSNFFTKVLNVQNTRYITITCEGCGFTQMYQTTQSFLANILDILVR